MFSGGVTFIMDNIKSSPPSPRVQLLTCKEHSTWICVLVDFHAKFHLPSGIELRTGYYHKAAN